MKDSHLAVLEQNEFRYEEETCINENFGLSDFCCIETQKLDISHFLQVSNCRLGP